MIRKFLAWMTWGVLVGCLGSVFAQGADEPETRRISVSFKPDKTAVPKVGVPKPKKERLAPELRALKHVDGRLLGRTDRGEAVIETQKKNADALFSKSAELGLRVSSEPDEFIPINQLILSYEAGKKPTEKSLKKAGLRIVDGGDYETGTFLIVEPIEKSGLTSKTVKALETIEDVTRAYPSHIITLPPQPPNEPPNDPGAEKAVEKSSKRLKASPSNSSTPSPVIPEDELFGQLWGMKQINAPVAWTSGVKSPVIVAVIDTGIDYNHSDLRANVWTSPSGTHGFNAIPGSDRNNPMDDNGHGTHCAGTIAAVANKSGVVGVNWEVKVMGLKFLDRAGRGSDFAAIRCIDFAIANGAKVLSNSWGGYSEIPELEEAIERAQRSGALFIAAASNDNLNNDGANPSYPSSYLADNIISVMSVDLGGAKSSFSNYGARSVDLAAPGRNILSTYPGGGFKPLSGTSMATPHVAGAAALLWAHPKFKQADWRGIKDALLKNVSKQSGLANLCGSGGILDLQFMGDSSGGEPTPPVTPSPVTPSPVTPQPVTGSVLVAYQKFVDPIQVTDQANVLKIRVELAEESDVLIRADSSVTSTANVKTVSTGFLNEEDPERRWEGSARRLSVKSSRWSPVVASYVVRLGRGSHHLYWKVWDDDSTGNTLTLNAGTMTVEAFPIRKQ